VDDWISLIANKFNLTFSYVDRIYDSAVKEPINRWVLLFPGSGCSWAKSEQGGCFMCGFKSRIDEITKDIRISPRELIEIYKASKSMVSGKMAENLTIYNGGSFLNNDEVPLEVQLEICEDVSSIPSIKVLFVESRPEFVTEEKISLLVSKLGGKKLKVGVGLECVSDDIREKCVNKGLSKEDFERAVVLLRNNGVEVLTYVFIKPLYITEREAISEAIRTTNYAFQVGSNEVTLEAALVQKGTKMEEVYRKGDFRPPWLWSVIEVLKATYQLGTVNVGDFTDEPPPIATPYNCEKCSSKITSLFNKYKESHEIDIFDKIDCDCKSIWRESLDKK